MVDRLAVLREIIEAETGIDVASLAKTNKYVFARAVYYKIARSLRNDNGDILSLSIIGRSVNKDHASVIHSLKYSFDQAMNESVFKSLFNKLCLMIEQPEWKFSSDKAKYYQTYASVSDMWDRTNNLWERYLKLKAKTANNPILDLIADLSEEEVNEVSDKLSIMVKAIKNRVYL